MGIGKLSDGNRTNLYEQIYTNDSSKWPDWGRWADGRAIDRIKLYCKRLATVHFFSRSSLFLYQVAIHRLCSIAKNNIPVILITSKLVFNTRLKLATQHTPQTFNYHSPYSSKLVHS